MKLFRVFVCIALFITILFISSIGAGLVHATERSDILATGTVQSFGSYQFAGKLTFDVAQSAITEIGRLQVTGTYNGPYPWIMRIYTENTHFQGVAGHIVAQSRAGLVSRDGRFAIPLEVNTPNLAAGQFITVPDSSDSAYITYLPATQPDKSKHTERIIMGIDPRNASWVSGPDRIIYTDDDNPLGDITIPTPFTLIFRARFGASSAQTEYMSRLVIEVVGVP